MARPQPDDFNNDIIRTPVSATSGTPISYAANVNRQKTKKWTQAKTVDYGGDDWGEDDYDDYEPEPPMPKPTGLRQAGQAATGGLTSPLDKKPYGDLPRTSNEAQRSATNPGLQRANSFDREDEKRAFSSSQMPQYQTPLSQPPPPELQNTAPPVLHVQTQQPSSGLRKPVGVPSNAATVPAQASEASVPASTTSSKYSQESGFQIDPQQRRDFSPSAVISPLQPRGSTTATPQTASDPVPSRFPPRKSSVGQQSQPDVSAMSQPADLSKSRTDQAISPTSTKAPAAGKALPFIRPADIYKRHLEEQAEKQRQSLDSSRPSMDSMQGSVQGKSSDRSVSPAVPNAQEDTGPMNTTAQYDRSQPEKQATYESTTPYYSSGRLMPVLEPVKERKSEYGFDNYDTAPLASPTHPTIGHSAITADATKDEIDAQRRYSTSPKLPDLNRISGFGMDMFLQQSADRPQLPATKEAEEVALTSSTLGPSSTTTDRDLKAQPSLGFTSVVHQAFDASNDSINPGTPASNSGSGVGRTDSESTGTTGISPIMSRVSSTATAETRARDNEARDYATPAIPEVQEPDSRRGSATVPDGVPQRKATPEQASKEVPGFQPGHRRDVSTPSPENSPARTPVLARTAPAANSESAHISEASGSSYTDDPLPPPQRPFAGERDHSFRPNLPGGWVSYGTSASVATAVPDDAQSTTSSAAQQSTEQHEQITNSFPTTHKEVSPKVAAGATGIALGSAALAMGDRTGSPSNGSVGAEIPRSLTPGTKDDASHSSVPFAPSANPYAASTVDPRLGPQSALQPPRPTLDTQTSSHPPTPPAKDTPQPQVETPRDSLYFPPTAPLKAKTSEQVASEHSLAPAVRNQAPPTLSVGTSPHDDDNDKLHKEIINSLSPKPSDSKIYSESSPVVTEDEPESSGAGARESMFLPSEYDSYWADTGDEPDVPEIPQNIKPDSTKEPQSAVSAMTPTDISLPAVAPLDVHGNREHEPTPLHVNKSIETRPPLENRFSWEAPSEEATLATPHIDEQKTNLRPTVSPQFTTGTDTKPRQLSETYSDDAAPIAMPVQSTIPSGSTEQEHHQGNSLVSSDKDAGIAAGGIAAGGITALAAASFAARRGSNEPSPAPDAQRRLSLAEEKSPANVSTYAIAQTPPEDEHPSNVPQSAASPLDRNSATVHNEAAPPKIVHRVSDMSKIPPFKDILAMNSSQSRIKAYNDSRHQFSMMDTGLGSWLSSIKSEHPEAVPFGSTPSAGNTGRSRQQGAPAQLQQPYYQQYLNASSPTATTPPASARPPTSGGFPTGQSGFSSSGSKLKGKELLSSAGKFGGMASKAGKGLLAKGKTKLRGSGAGDKENTSTEARDTSESPAPTTKSSRRTSWGLPLSLSRSAGRTDESLTQPQSQGPTPDGTPSRHPLPRLNSNIVPTGISHFSEREIIPGESSTRTASSISSVESATEAPELVAGQHSTDQGTQISSIPVDQLEERDTLGVPAPISKSQPSWDPFNATPIAEEEGFQYDRTKHHSLSVPGHAAEESAVRISDASKSDRSDAFFDAPEEQDGSEEWVMVPKTGVPSEPQAKAAEPPISPLESTAPSAPLYQGPPPVSSSQIGNRDSAPAQISTYQTSQFDPQQTPTPAPKHQSLPTGEGNPNFVGLPPIRRSSTFGLGFGSKKNKERFPIDDDDEEQYQMAGSNAAPNIQADHDQNSHGGMTSAAALGSAALLGSGIAHGMNNNSATGTYRHPSPNLSDEMMRGAVDTTHPPSYNNFVGSQRTSQPQPLRSDHLTNDNDQGRHIADPGPQPSQIPQQTGPVHQRHPSADAYRVRSGSQSSIQQSPHPGRTPSIISQVSTLGTGAPPQAVGQHRPNSSSGPSVNAPQYSQYPRPPPQKLPDQPPSSAQRYPDLFRQEQALPRPPVKDDNLPAQYYPGPVTREEAFLPRQQAAEYSIPGVGPDERQTRRNSGFFKEIGGKISRATSRDRSSSRAREGRQSPRRTATGDSKDFDRDFEKDSINSDELLDKNKRRSSFFGALSRTATGGTLPGQQAEKPSTPRENFMAQPNQPSPLVPSAEKKRFFGLGGPKFQQGAEPVTSHIEPGKKSGLIQKPFRSSTGGPVPGDDSGKKKRFSGWKDIVRGSTDNDRKNQQQVGPQGQFQGPPGGPMMQGGRGQGPPQLNQYGQPLGPGQFQGPSQFMQGPPGQQMSPQQGFQGIPGAAGAQNPPRQGPPQKMPPQHLMPKQGVHAPQNLQDSAIQRPPMQQYGSGSEILMSGAQQATPDRPFLGTQQPSWEGTPPPRNAQRLSGGAVPRVEGGSPVPLAQHNRGANNQAISPSPIVQEAQRSDEHQYTPPVGPPPGWSAQNVPPPSITSPQNPQRPEQQPRIPSEGAFHIANSPQNEKHMATASAAEIIDREAERRASQDVRPTASPQPQQHVQSQQPLQQPQPQRNDLRMISGGSFQDVPVTGSPLPGPQLSQQKQPQRHDHLRMVSDGSFQDVPITSSPVPKAEERRVSATQLVGPQRQSPLGTQQTQAPQPGPQGLRQPTQYYGPNQVGMPPGAQSPSQVQGQSPVQQNGPPGMPQNMRYQNGQGPVMAPQQRFSPVQNQGGAPPGVPYGQAGKGDSPIQGGLPLPGNVANSHQDRQAMRHQQQPKKEEKSRRSSGLFAGVAGLMAGNKLGKKNKNQPEPIQERRQSQQGVPPPQQWKQQQPGLQNQQQQQYGQQMPLGQQSQLQGQQQFQQQQPPQNSRAAPSLLTSNLPPERQHLRSPDASKPPVNISRAPDQRQERGRQLFQEPRYEPTPIPGAYGLVRGDPGYGGPGNPDPRFVQQLPQGMQGHQGPYNQQQSQPYSQQGQYIHPDDLQPPPRLSMQRDGSYSSGSPVHQTANHSPSRRPLSKEDLVARSPARKQFGQQAPYQLSLPEQDAEPESPRNLHQPVERNLPAIPNAPAGYGQPIGAIPNNQREIPPQIPQPATRALPALSTGPAQNLRNPSNPASYPLPDSMFSPVDPRAAQIPAPPPPANFNSLAPSPPQVQSSLDRSNTINTINTDVSQMSQSTMSQGTTGPVESTLTVPTQGNGKEPRSQSITPPTPGQTPNIDSMRDQNVSPPDQTIKSSQDQRRSMNQSTPDNVNDHAMVRPQQSRDDIYDATPPSSRAEQRIVRDDAAGQGQVIGAPTPASERTIVYGDHPGAASNQPSLPQQPPTQKSHLPAAAAVAAGAGAVGGVATAAALSSSNTDQSSTPTQSTSGGLEPIQNQPEEKIWVGGSGAYGSGGGFIAEMDADPTPVMSATSYPGMEWNPYGAGAWDDGFD